MSEQGKEKGRGAATVLQENPGPQPATTLEARLVKSSSAVARRIFVVRTFVISWRAKDVEVAV
jgi:hypothetical protein